MVSYSASEEAERTRTTRWVFVLFNELAPCGFCVCIRIALVVLVLSGSLLNGKGRDLSAYRALH